MNILLIEDDHTLSTNIKDALIAADFAVDMIYDGLLAARTLTQQQFDCVIMDVNIPGQNGFDLCKQFRQFNDYTPVLMLTAFGELQDKVKGFDSGADDYLTKPFFMRELILRVQSLIKRSYTTNVNSRQTATYLAADILLNDQEKKVFRQDQEILLTPREYQILFKLIQHPGNLISKADLIKEIWGSSVSVNTNTIEVYVNFLRNKLDKPFGKNTIKTKVGYGYYLDV